MTTSVIFIIVVLESIALRVSWPSVVMRSASGRVGMTRILIRSEISFYQCQMLISMLRTAAGIQRCIFEILMLRIKVAWSVLPLH
jgi:hypothetical protein